MYEVDEATGLIVLLFVYDKAERESLPAHRIMELLSTAKTMLGIED